MTDVLVGFLFLLQLWEWILSLKFFSDINIYLSYSATVKLKIINNGQLGARRSYRVTQRRTNKHCERDLSFTKLLHLDIRILFRGSADQFSEDSVLNGANAHNRKLAV